MALVNHLGPPSTTDNNPIDRLVSSKIVTKLIIKYRKSQAFPVSDTVLGFFLFLLAEAEV